MQINMSSDSNKQNKIDTLLEVEHLKQRATLTFNNLEVRTRRTFEKNAYKPRKYKYQVWGSMVRATR